MEPPVELTEGIGTQLAQLTVASSPRRSGDSGTAYMLASASLMRRVGDELIKDPHTAFFELVKNSYDADATKVVIEFKKSTLPEGRITITDNGEGMSDDDLHSKWLRMGTENKLLEPYTNRYSRRKLGSKGVGRFSAGKIGRSLKVRTRQVEDHAQLTFKVDYDLFVDERDLNEVPIHYRMGPPKANFSHGTRLEITQLTESWGKREIKRLKQQLSTLVDPSVESQSFTIEFECPEWPEFSGPLVNPASGQETHILQFAIDGDGNYEFSIDPSSRKVKEKRDPLSCGPVRGELRYFKSGLKTSRRKLTSDSDETHMGVWVLRDSFRVRPYGEVGNDWLNVKAKRSTKGGKYFVLPQNLAGKVFVSGSGNPDLQDETNRESGMQENEAFSDFQQFVADHVDILNRILESETKSESQKKRRHTVQKILDTIIDVLNEQESDSYEKHVREIDRSKSGNVGVSRKKSETVTRDRKNPNKRTWHCKDCDAKWRTLVDKTPSICCQFAVRQDGSERRVTGCGSTNIELAHNKPKTNDIILSSIVSGSYAMVGGRQLRVRVDHDEMGQKDDEFSFDGREIVINGSHPAFECAEMLDEHSGKKYEIGDDVFVPAISTHITKCVCLAWAEIHFAEKKDWNDYKHAYEQLQDEIVTTIAGRL